MYVMNIGSFAPVRTIALTLAASGEQSVPWATIAALVSSGASVLGLIFVAFQLRSLAEQTREQSKQVKASTDAISASTYIEIVKCQIQQDLFLARHPGIRKSLYGRLDGRSRQKRLHGVEGVAEAFVDMIDMAIVKSEYVPESVQVLWKKYATDLMTNSCGFRTYWRQNREWYERDVQQFFDEALSIAESRQVMFKRSIWHTCNDAVARMVKGKANRS